MNKRNWGKLKEQQAAAFLKGCGFEIISLNYWSKSGEIDIIATKEDIIIFVEVKSSQYDVNSLEYSVNKRKQERIIGASRDYLQKNYKKNARIRYDIVFISNKNSDIYHIENAFCEG
ncbi:MAG: YraN family protein [Spirochaetales bacterium]|nr:YraN family protein [Spirochaetales bacterium]